MLPNDALPSPPLVPGSSARWPGLLIAGLASLSRSSLRLSRGANSLPRDLVLPSYLDCRDDLPQYVRHRRITRKVIAQQWIRLSDRSFPRRQSEDRDDGPQRAEARARCTSANSLCELYRALSAPTTICAASSAIAQSERFRSTGSVPFLRHTLTRKATTRSDPTSTIERWTSWITTSPIVAGLEKPAGHDVHADCAPALTTIEPEMTTRKDPTKGDPGESSGSVEQRPRPIWLDERRDRGHRHDGEKQRGDQEVQRHSDGALFVNTVIAPSTICTAITPTDIRAGPRT